MGTPHRTPEQMLEHRAQAAAWHKEGRSNLEIAEMLGIEPYTVSRDLAFVRAKLMENAINDLDAARKAELAKLDVIEAEAWEAWERSKQPRISKSATKGDTVNKQSVKEEERGGDPRYMEIILRCSDQRAKILGLVVNKVDMTSAGKPMQPIQMVEIERPAPRNDAEQPVLH